MIIDCISDLHGHYPELSGGDVLIVAGDLTAKHSYQEYVDFGTWFEKQPYRKKIFIAGNHDDLIQNTDIVDDVLYPFDYLQDSGTKFEGLKIWGSPWTLFFNRINPLCTAFTMPNEHELQKKWDLIPHDTDILITHMPPFGILDKTARKEYVGSKSLRNHLLAKSKAKIHVFGHVHEQGGKIFDSGLCMFFNASHVDEYYEPKNLPSRIKFKEVNEDGKHCTDSETTKAYHKMAYSMDSASSESST